MNEFIDKYLSSNFDTIQSLRKANGFSWKPVLEGINEEYAVGLDPENENHRDHVRGRFLRMRKKTTPSYEASEHQKLDTYTVKVNPPKTEKEEFEQWREMKSKLKKQEGLHVVAGCIHFPAVNKVFFEAFLKFLEDNKKELRGIHLIGDILDCKSLSQHDKGQVSDTTLEAEYRESNIYLDKLDAVLPDGIEKNYIWGNHEERYTRALKNVDLAKFGRALLSPTAGGKFIERGYTVQEDYMNAKIQLGKYLDLIHGQYITANACKKHLDVYKKSIMFAHTHKAGAHYDSDKASFNIGWMGDKNHPAFNYCSRVTKEGWQNGFAVVNIDSEGFYHVQLIQYYNNRFFYGGKEYK